MGQIEQYNTAVQSIYAASMDASLWSSSLDAMAQFMGGFGGNLILWDKTTGLIPSLHSSGFPLDVMERDYAQHYVKIDPRAEHFLAHPETRIYYDYLYTDERQMLRSEYYDWEYRETPQRYALGARLVVTNSYEAVFSVARNKRQEHPESNEIELFANHLVPHMQQAVEISRRLAGNVEAEALNRLSSGIVILDGSGEVLFANRAVRRMCNGQDGLSLSASGLTAWRRPETLKLEALVATVLNQDREVKYAGGAVLVGRPSGKRPFSVLVAPLPSREEFFAFSQPAAIILVSDLDSDSEGGGSVFSQLFGLTKAEERVATGLVSQLTLERIADEGAVSINTVRSHLNNIFRKTSTNRQADLVNLLIRAVSGLSVS